MKSTQTMITIGLVWWDVTEVKEKNQVGGSGTKFNKWNLLYERINSRSESKESMRRVEENM